MFTWLTSLLRSIVKLFKKLWETIKPWIAIIALVLLVLAPVLYPFIAGLSWTAGLAWLPALYTALGTAGWWVSGLVGLGVASIIDSGAVIDTANKVISTVGTVATSAVDTALDVTSGVVSTVITSPGFLWIAAIVGGWFLLSNHKDNDQQAVKKEQPKRDPVETINGSNSIMGYVDG